MWKEPKTAPTGLRLWSRRRAPKSCGWSTCRTNTPEDDELGRAQRGDPDQANQATVVEIVLRHRRAVTLDEIRLVDGFASRWPT